MKLTLKAGADQNNRKLVNEENIRMLITLQSKITLQITQFKSYIAG